MMLNDTLEVPCPVCGSSDSKFLFSTKDYVFQCSEDIFGVRKCSVCTCGYLSPRPKRNDIQGYYPKEFYWSWEGEAGALSWQDILEKRKAQLEEKAKWLPDLKSGRLLDIGAQKGEFLWYMGQRGWVTEGVELDSTVPNPAGMPIRYGDFLEMEFEEGVYDVVTFWAVLEHVYEPSLFLEKASKLLRPGGLLIGLVTNINSIQSRIYKADDYPRHLTIFSTGSLQRVTQQNGLVLQTTHTGQEIFGGSLAGGVLYLIKRMLGYSQEDAMSEWKQIKDPDLFWCKWRGRNSFAIKMVSRLDRLVTRPLEPVLDKLGFGFILTFSATKMDIEQKASV
jgi:2-polyprenyl-3-methyl-5-hydroxy-6-metoxy-1,4-benzoquinol methylase